MVMPYNIAPRISVYPFGSIPAPLEQGWLSLPQLRRSGGSEVVFGDGSHATTRLCAGVVDLICRQRNPYAVLDVGTGTGVLARIARARGAQFIVGTDIDPTALAVARTHCELDGHAVEIHLGAEPPDHWGARFDVVVANILEEPLRQLASALRRALKPGGVLLLSGITPVQSPALRVLYEKEGLILSREAHLEGWALLMFEHSSAG
jgi:ribosomal protein L11 methyltransferase